MTKHSLLWATLAALALAVPTAARAKPKAKPKALDLATYEDAATHVSFPYPKTWRNITIAEDGSKAEARSESGGGKLTIEAVVMPKEGGVSGLLERRLP